MLNVLSFLRKQPVPIPDQNLWGEESTKDSWKEMYSFPNSVWAAIQFVFAAIHGKLPQQIQEQIRFDESTLPKELRLHKIFDNFGMQDHGTGRYRDRTLYFSFSPSCTDEDCLKVYLRQYAGSEAWKIITATYLRKYVGDDSGCSHEHYEVVVEQYIINEGTERACFAESGFRISSY